MPKKFSIPKGVTMENATSYITAVEETVEKEITSFPVGERRLVLAAIMSSFQIAEQKLYLLMKEAEAAEKQLS